jgi:hypothetical protein
MRGFTWSPASYWRGLGSVLGQSIWDLCVGQSDSEAEFSQSSYSCQLPFL